MSESTAYILLVIAIIIIAVLGFFAYRTIKALKDKQQLNEKRLAQVIADQKERREYAENSIRLIAIGAVDEQLDLIEACIRLNGLMDFMGYTEDQRANFGVFAEIAEATREIPMNDDWKALDKKEKRRHRKTMIQLQLKHQERIDAALEDLKAANYLSDKPKSGQPMFYSA